jgi:thiamine biosynthesis lipoprotein
VPTKAELQTAIGNIGMRQVVFDEETYSVRFQREGIEIDLGGFGKGYAVQRAIDSLRENGINSAFLHGGTSSVATLGTPPAQDAWRIELPSVFQEAGQPKVISLVENGLSVSALHGKYFLADGLRFGHIINPITGEPVRETLAAAVVGKDAAVCEALSKAWLIHSSDWLQKVAERFPEYRCLLAAGDENLAAV